LDGPPDADPHRIVIGLLVAIMTAAKTNPCSGALTGTALMQINARS
jgi:hypothetical protein